MEDYSSVNWLAVIVSTILSFLLGWLWYSPKMFGIKWAEGTGVSLDSADKMPVLAMVTQFIALLLLATVVGITATFSALVTAILAILAAALFVASSGAFANKSHYAIRVELSYIVVAGVLMIVCQAVL